MSVVIFTPIELEYQAVKPHLSSFKEEMDASGDLYGFGTVKGKNGNIKVMLRLTGSKNHIITLATERAMTKIEPKPKFALLVGICGGVKDVVIGDVVVGTQAYGFSGGKVQEDGLQNRPQVIPFSHNLIELAHKVKNEEKWQLRLEEKYMGPLKVIFGPIGSDDKVIATTKSVFYDNMKHHYNDTTALEMESIGFATAMHRHHPSMFINIRGVSDLLDNKSHTDKEGGQEKAAARAAAFAIELIAQLEWSSDTNTYYIMDIQTLVTKLFKAILFNFSGNSKPNDLPHLNSIIDKVKPIIGDLFDDLKENPDDEEAQTELRSKLKRTLNKNENLRDELEKLLNQFETANPQVIPSVSISNSKNVIQGSNINAGGNIQIGDQNTTTTNTNTTNIDRQVNVDSDFSGTIIMGDMVNITQIIKESSSGSQKPVNQIKEEIRKAIQSGRVKTGLELLLKLTKDDMDYQNTAIQLSARWNELQKGIIRGTISQEQINVQQNRIIHAILETVDLMD